MCDMTMSQEFAPAPLSPAQAVSFYAHVLDALVDCYEEKGAAADVREVADVVRRQLRIGGEFDWKVEQQLLARAMRSSEFRLSLQLAYMLATVKSQRTRLQHSWHQVERLLEAITQGARIDSAELRSFAGQLHHYTDLTERDLPCLLAELRLSLQHPEARLAGLPESALAA